MTERAELVKQLRGWDHCWLAKWLEDVTAKAADMLEADARRIAELEAALKDILFWTEDCGPHAEQIERIVHAALEGK